MKIAPLSAQSKIVVFDAGGPFGVENKLFDRDVVKERHGLASCYLYEECLRHGIQLLTPDLFYALREKPARVIFVRNNIIESESRKLIERGAYPAVLMGFEYPLYACSFYWNLGKNTENFDYVLMPRGAASWARPKKKFIPWLSPQPYTKEMHAESNFGSKQYLTMISGNARIRPLKRLYVKVMHAMHPLPTLVDRELYVDRLEAIQYFSKAKDFDLYGRGWDHPVLYTKGKYAEAIKASYRGEVEDKLPVLQKYKFSICFENCIFGGWITEKIIDSLYAGCVPVYWGAPDITEYIPADTFIDFRKFKNFEELDAYLRNMDEVTYNRYIDAINRFIVSEKADAWSEKQYAKDMIAIFNSYF